MPSSSRQPFTANAARRKQLIGSRRQSKIRLASEINGMSNYLVAEEGEGLTSCKALVLESPSVALAASIHLWHQRAARRRTLYQWW